MATLTCPLLSSLSVYHIQHSAAGTHPLHLAHFHQGHAVVLHAVEQQRGHSDPPVEGNITLGPALSASHVLQHVARRRGDGGAGEGIGGKVLPAWGVQDLTTVVWKGVRGNIILNDCGRVREEAQG